MSQGSDNFEDAKDAPSLVKRVVSIYTVDGRHIPYVMWRRKDFCTHEVLVDPRECLPNAAAITTKAKAIAVRDHVERCKRRPLENAR